MQGAGAECHLRHPFVWRYVCGRGMPPSFFTPAWQAVAQGGADSDVLICACRLPKPPHSKAAIDAAKLLNIKKFSMSSNMNMEHDSMVVNRLVSLVCVILSRSVFSPFCTCSIGVWLQHQATTAVCSIAHRKCSDHEL